MTEGKIQQAVKKLVELRDKLKDLKKEKRIFEKVTDSDKYEELKKTKKEIHAQIKEIEGEHEKEIAEDEDYRTTREEILEVEENIAEEKALLLEAAVKLKSGKSFEMEVIVDGEWPVKLQALQETRVYLNGKEEKVMD